MFNVQCKKSAVAVRLALLEFGFSEEESQNLGRFSLCRVSCLDTNFIRQTRLPGPGCYKP